MVDEQEDGETSGCFCLLVTAPRALLIMFPFVKKEKRDRGNSLTALPRNPGR